MDWPEIYDNKWWKADLAQLYDERHNPVFEQLGSHFETAASWTTAIDEHRAVIDAIAAHSPEAAREAMATHLARSHDRFTVSIASGAAPARTPPAAGNTPATAPRRRASRKAA